MATKRRDWFASQPSVDQDRLVFLDETGLRTDLKRTRGWSDIGERLVEPVPNGRWTTCTLLHAIALDGTRAAMVLDGPVNTLSFCGFCEWLLAPSLRAGDIVVMDNLNVHKSLHAPQTVEAVGAHAIYLPPYSPDLNPIENIFSKLKQLIRSAKPRKLKQIVKAVAEALVEITLDDIQAVFDHAGYLAHE